MLDHTSVCPGASPRTSCLAVRRRKGAAAKQRIVLPDPPGPTAGCAANTNDYETETSLPPDRHPLMTTLPSYPLKRS